MKIALYIEDGLEQIVLTPDSDTERSILKKIDGRNLSVCHGHFYHCQGGWVRHGPQQQESTILVLRKLNDDIGLKDVELG